MAKLPRNLKTQRCQAAQRKSAKWKLIGGRGKCESDSYHGKIGSSRVITAKGYLRRRRLAVLRAQSTRNASRGKILNQASDTPQVVPDAPNVGPLPNASEREKRKRGEEDWRVTKRRKISRGLRRRSAALEGKGGRPVLEMHDKTHKGIHRSRPPLHTGANNISAGGTSENSLADLSTTTISSGMIIEGGSVNNTSHTHTPSIKPSELMVSGDPSSDSDLCDLDDGGCASLGRTASYQSSERCKPNDSNDVGDPADPADFRDLSDGEPDVYNITLLDKLPPCPSDPEQHTDRDAAPFLSSTPHQRTGYTRYKNYLKRVRSHARAVSDDMGAENPANLSGEFSADLSAVEFKGSKDLFHNSCDKYQRPEAHQTKADDPQSIPGMPIEPSTSLRRRGGYHSEERGTNHSISYVEKPVVVVKDCPKLPSELSSDTDVLCSLYDEYHGIAGGELIPSHGHQSPTPSTQSPLSYHDDNGNSSANGSPSHVNLRHGDSGADDSMDISEASKHAVPVEPPDRPGDEAFPTGQILVAEYRSTPERSTISDLCDGQSIDLPVEECMSVTVAQEVHRDRDEWNALPQLKYGPGSDPQSPQLLDLDEDYGIGFEVAPRDLSPIQNEVSTPSCSTSEQQPRRRRKNRKQYQAKELSRLRDGENHEGSEDVVPQAPESHARVSVQEESAYSKRDLHITRALQRLTEVLQKVVENNDTQLREMGSMLRNFTETPLRPFHQSAHNDEGCPRASKNEGRHMISLALKRHIRTHSLVMLGRKDKNALVPPPPSSDQIKTFLEMGKRGPKGEAGELRLDFEGPIRSPWNKKAARCFRRHFQKSGLYGPWPKADIEEAFLRHTETIRSHYQRQIGAFTEDDLLLRRTRSAGKTRLQKLAKDRIYVCRTSEDLHKFERYVRKLADDGGMSGDESDRSTKQKDKKYFVVRPIWRSQEVTEWLRVMDLVYISSRFAADGRATKGNWVRNRIQSTRVDRDSKPIPGLPHNFYDQTWLEAQTRREKKALKMREAIDLGHSEEIIRLAARYKSVKSRLDKPT